MNRKSSSPVIEKRVCCHLIATDRSGQILRSGNTREKSPDDFNIGPMKVEITAEDLSRYPWRDVFHKTKPAVATEFEKAFASLRNKCLNMRDGRGGKVYGFLCRICEWPKPAKAAEAIVGVPVGSEESSPTDEEEELEGLFSQDELDLAFELLGSTIDPEFRALLADIIVELRDNEIESVQIAAGANLPALETVNISRR